jgi:hypothetical protein
LPARKPAPTISLFVVRWAGGADRWEGYFRCRVIVRDGVRRAIIGSSGFDRSPQAFQHPDDAPDRLEFRIPAEITSCQESRAAWNK